MASAERLRRSVRGLSEAEFRERFGTEGASREALLAMRWREGLTCPACGRGGSCTLETRKVFQCNRCKKQLSLTAGTVSQDSKLPLTTWFSAVCHLAQAKGGISSIELARRLGVRQPTAWLMRHKKLMRAMAAREAEGPKPSGRVEIDDAYLARRRAPGRQARAGGGRQDAAPVVAAVETTAERKPRRLRLSVVRGFRKREVEKVADRARPRAGEQRGQRRALLLAGGREGRVLAPPHGDRRRQEGRELDAVRVGEHGPRRRRDGAETALAGTYHHVSAKHAQSNPT